jgi:hypothetical protein
MNDGCAAAPLGGESVPAESLRDDLGARTPAAAAWAAPWLTKVWTNRRARVERTAFAQEIEASNQGGGWGYIVIDPTEAPRQAAQRGS